MNRKAGIRAAQSARRFEKWHDETKVPVKTPSSLPFGRLTGTVTKWDQRMGMIEREGAKFFLHYNFVAERANELHVGDQVEFTPVEIVEGCWQAHHVRRVLEAQ